MKVPIDVKTQILWTLVTAALISFSPTAIADDYLSADEVTQLVSGKTVEAKKAVKTVSIITYFSHDGTFRQLRDGEPQKGTWHVDEDGRLCVNREHWGTGCRRIAKEGDVWKMYKVPKDFTKSRKHQRTILRILDGNPHNL